MNIFEKYLQNYIEHLKIIKQSDSTIDSYTHNINCFLKWVIDKGIYDLREITHEQLKEYQFLLINELDKRYSINTIHLKQRSVKQFFAYLEKTQVLLYNPAEKMILPKLGSRLPKVILTEKEMERLLQAPNTGAFTGIRDRAIMELLYSTGIRRAECVRLKVYDVDYKGGYLRINQGKGGKDRVVPLGKKACDWLKEYILKVRTQLLNNNREERILFINRYGDPLTGQSINLIIKTHARKAKLTKQVTVHALRRSFATHMLKNQANPIYIQRILGHSNMEVLKKYIKIAGIDLKKTHRKTHPREKNRK